MTRRGSEDHQSNLPLTYLVNVPNDLPVSLPPSKEKPPSWNAFQAILKLGKHREVKKGLRNGGWGWNDPIRAHLWHEIMKYLHSSSHIHDTYYEETAAQLFPESDAENKKLAFPAFVDREHVEERFLNEKGRKVALRIVYVLGYSYPDITFSPLLYPLTAIMLHYMPEDAAYMCVNMLLSGKTVTQTKLAYECRWRTLLHLCKKYAKPAWSHLNASLNNPEKLDHLFEGWLWWIFADLPFPHLVRVIDCYLLEGPKVLYRVALAILLLFYKQGHLVSTSEANNLPEAISHFSRNIPVGTEKLLKWSFSIRGFSRQEIERLRWKTEVWLNSRSRRGSGSTSPRITRSRSMDLPTCQSQAHMKMISHTLPIPELLMLWSWLPTRMTMYQPKLLYTTEEHGCSITTFFSRVEEQEATVLLIKSHNDEVFGAYCSAPWGERKRKNEITGYKHTYFGTGETFVFTLHPRAMKYAWVGIKQQQDVEGPSCMRHAAQLFMAADQHMITIGGGRGQAIWIDADICYGKTESCQTFENPPLCSESDFQIKVLEVIGFT